MPLLITTIMLTLLFSVPAFTHESEEHPLDDNFYSLFQIDDLELTENRGDLDSFACSKATKSQKSTISLGNQKKTKFLTQCRAATGNSDWCDQLVRPNPASKNIFECTYGSSQVHQLIHPNESTWKHAINAVKLIQELDTKGIKTCLIYNWWRPEPYNRNVGGAPGRHPYGTSIDVRFCDNDTAVLAFKELCKYRRQGRIRAIGYYGSSALHFGIGDSTGNTWGKSCQ